MQRWLGRLRALLLLLFAAGGCTTARSSPPTPRASDSGLAMPSPLLTPAADLSGSWYTGMGEEPAMPAVVLHPPCAVNPAAWVIDHKGNAIQAWMFPETFNQGIKVANDPIARVAPAEGWVSGSEIALTDGTYTFRLRFDSASSHLRGTRNGEPFWAVRQQVIRTSACPPPP